MASSTSVFTKDDYESNDGMLTTVWGPSQWHFLHTMSFNYPIHPTEKQKKAYRNYMLLLKDVLPCGKCRTNLKENYIKLPLRMSNMRNRETFSKYVYDLHELVNDMLGKTSGLTYDQVRERYEHFRSRCTKTKRELLKKRKTMKQKTTKRKNEKGCTEPLVGEKSKCILKIVPEKTKCASFSMDKKCVKTRMS
jgi:hypothetical protein